jgi:hypothetical protein
MITSGSLVLETIRGGPLLFLFRLRKAEEGIASKIRNDGRWKTSLPLDRLRKSGHVPSARIVA